MEHGFDYELVRHPRSSIVFGVIENRRPAQSLRLQMASEGLARFELDEAFLWRIPRNRAPAQRKIRFWVGLLAPGSDVLPWRTPSPLQEAVTGFAWPSHVTKQSVCVSPTADRPRCAWPPPIHRPTGEVRRRHYLHLMRLSSTPTPSIRIFPDISQSYTSPSSSLLITIVASSRKTQHRRC